MVDNISNDTTTGTEVAAFTIDKSFEGRDEYRLFSMGDDARFYRLTYTYVNQSYLKEPEIHQVNVSSTHIQACFDKLEHSKIPANPAFAVGLDGTTFSLVLSHGPSETIYTWWSYYPVGYEPLAEFAEALLEATGLPYSPLCSVEGSGVM